MNPDRGKEERNNISLGIAIVILAVAIGFFFTHQNGNGSNYSTNADKQLNQAVGINTSTSQPNAGGNSSSPTYSQHASDYVYAYLSTISWLYRSTQSFSRAQQLLGSNSSNQATVMLTALDETINDLKSAAANLTSYLNDGDRPISTTAKLLYADTELELKSVTQLQSSLTDAIEYQSVSALNSAQTEMASFAAAKDSLENDLSQAIQIVKYVIENPTSNPNPSGPISYAISPDDRKYLLNQLDSLFPGELNQVAAKNSIYLLDARAIAMFLSAGTYEQQAQDASQL